MPPTNDFVPFCNENTGTNLPTQSAYVANPNLPIGNQPGIASSSFVNKALRQATTIGAVLAQFISNTLAADVLDNQNTADHANPPTLLGQMTAAHKYHSPVVTKYLSSSGNHNLTFKFQIASGNATAAATYSDGTTTYTVSTTIAGGTQLDATGGAVPVNPSGTLTKLTGSGDATITYYAFRKPLYLRVKAAGGGAGGQGGGTTQPAGGSGGNTTFGTTLIVANGGAPAAVNAVPAGIGGTGSLGSGPVGVAVQGQSGATGGATVATSTRCPGGQGGNTPYFSGGGQGLGFNSTGEPGIANTGGGGQGGGNGAAANSVAGAGGGSGAFVDAIINTPLAQYAYAIGAAGTAGAAGTSGQAGGAGAVGIIIVEEHYQ